MSRHQLLASVFVIITGAFAGYYGVQFFQTQKNPNRFIASQPMMAKIGLEQNSRHFFDITINTDNLAQKDQEVSEIKVTVTARRPLSAGLIYNWHLTENMQTLEGHLQDQLGTLAVGESKEFILKVRGFSKEQRQYISFEIKGDTAGIPLRRDVLISSRIEDSLEYAIQQNELQQQQNAGSQKIQGQSRSRGKFDPENVIR